MATLAYAPACFRTLPQGFARSRSRMLAYAPAHSHTARPLLYAPVRSRTLPYAPARSRTLPQSRPLPHVRVQCRALRTPSSSCRLPRTPTRFGRSNPLLHAPGRCCTLPYAPARFPIFPHALVGARVLPHALQDDAAQELLQAGPRRNYRKLSSSQSIYKLKVINVGVCRYTLVDK